MKPRNKHERHVVEVSDRLPQLTNVQMEYAFEHCFKHKYVKRCGMYHCLDCGFEWPAGTNDVTLFDSMGGADCPVCGHHLEVEVTRKKSWFARSSFQIVTAVDDVQFVRTFYLRKYSASRRTTGSMRPSGCASCRASRMSSSRGR